MKFSEIRSFKDILRTFYVKSYFKSSIYLFQEALRSYNDLLLYSVITLININYQPEIMKNLFIFDSISKFLK